MARREKPPWFAFDAGDWLTSEDVDFMTLEQEGAYVRLLAFQWERGSIPSSREKLTQMLTKRGQKTLRDFDDLWSVVGPLFAVVEGGDRLRNERLERERARYEETCEKKRKGALDRQARERGHAVDEQCISTGQPREEEEKRRRREEEEKKEPPTPFPGGGFLTHQEAKPPRKRKPPKPDPDLPPLPFRAVEAIQVLSRASSSRFVAVEPTVREAIAIEALIRKHPDIHAWGRAGEWLAAGGDGWRSSCDTRDVKHLAAWIAHGQAWDGRPIAAKANGTNGRPQAQVVPDCVTNDVNRARLDELFARPARGS